MVLTSEKTAETRKWKSPLNSQRARAIRLDYRKSRPATPRTCPAGCAKPGAGHEKRPRRAPWWVWPSRGHTASVHHLSQFASGVARSQDLQAAALDLGGLAFATELEVALLAHGLGSFAGGLEPFAGIELVGVLGQELAHGAGHGQANVGVDVDLAHAVLDGFLDLGDRHAVGFLHLAAVLVDDGQQFLRHRRRTVHHQ